VPGAPVHWLAGLTPGGIVPVHVTVVVAPAAGAATVCDGGVEASAGPLIATSPATTVGTAQRIVLRMTAPFAPRYTGL